MGRDLEKVLPTRDPLATAVLMLLIGIVMIAMRSGAIAIVVIFAGVMLMVYGSSSLSRGLRLSDAGSDLVIGVLASALGLLLIVATGYMMALLTILMGVFLMALGVMSAVSNMDAGSRRKRVALIVAAVMVVLGLLLVVNPGTTTNTMMLVIGVVLVVLSAFSIWTYVR